MVDVNALLDERARTHGHFPEHAAITQHIKDLLRSQRNWSGLTASQKESLDMIAHKIGRILAGNPHFEDHWADISGYSTLAEREVASRRDYAKSNERPSLSDILKQAAE